MSLTLARHSALRRWHRAAFMRPLPGPPHPSPEGFGSAPWLVSNPPHPNLLQQPVNNSTKAWTMCVLKLLVQSVTCFRF